MTFPPEYDPPSQQGGGAQPRPLGNQPYPPPGQQYPPPGQPYTGMPGQQPYAGMPGQPYGQPNEPYAGAPPGMAYQPGQPVGVPPAYQQMGASNIANVTRSRGIRQIVIGAVIFVIGLIITVATYSAASSSRTGGTYFVAYGPMLIGVIGMIRGAIAVAQAKRLG